MPGTAAAAATLLNDGDGESPTEQGADELTPQLRNLCSDMIITESDSDVYDAAPNEEPPAVGSSRGNASHIELPPTQALYSSVAKLLAKVVPDSTSLKIYDHLRCQLKGSRAGGSSMLPREKADYKRAETTL